MGDPVRSVLYGNVRTIEINTQNNRILPCGAHRVDIWVFTIQDRHSLEK